MSSVAYIGIEGLTNPFSIHLVCCRSSLAALFAERGQAVMLVEAAVRLGSMPHAVVDVVPADRHVAQLDVKAGFKQVRNPCYDRYKTFVLLAGGALFLK